MSYNNLQKEKLSILATTATSGDIVQWNGSDWVNVNFPFDLTGITNGDILVFNGTEFVAQPLLGSSSIEYKFVSAPIGNSPATYSVSDFTKDETIILVDCSIEYKEIILPDPSLFLSPKKITIKQNTSIGIDERTFITLFNNPTIGSDDETVQDVLHAQKESITYVVDGIKYRKIGRIRRAHEKKLSNLITSSGFTNYTGGTQIAIVDSSSGAITITLPNNSGIGFWGGDKNNLTEIIIKDVGNSALTNNITIIPTSGEKIEGIVNGTLVIAQNGGSYRLAYDKANSNWMVI